MLQFWSFWRHDSGEHGREDSKDTFYEGQVLKSFWRQGSGEQSAEDSEDKNVLNEIWRLWRQGFEGTDFEDSEDITSKERVLKILKIVSAEQRS